MAWFRILYSRNAFVRSLDRRSPDALSPAEGLRAMAAFYRDHRPQHAEEDVLEVRWGSSDEYQLSIVRRMRRHDQPERVLELSYAFAATPQRTALGDGQQALDDPAATADFVRRVSSSAAWKVVSGAAVRRRSLTEA